MHLIGRWERVRELGPQGWGHGYVLDRKWSQLLPLKGEWWKTRSGMWLPVALIEQRGSSSFGRLGSPLVGTAIGDTLSFSVFSVNSAYTYGSAGAASGARIPMLNTLTLNDVYFRINSYGGTAANTNDIDVEIRNDSGKPGSTLLATQTVNPSSATGWIKVTGYSLSMTAGTTYWVVVCDPDATGTDFASISHRVGYSAGLTDQMNVAGALSSPATTANGFSTITLVTNTLMIIVLHFSDGTCVGFPFGSSNVVASDTNQKGLWMGGALSSDVRLWGVSGVSANANWNAVNIYKGTDGPTATPYATTSSAIQDIATATNLFGFIFGGGVTLFGGQDYRIVFGYGSASTSPRKHSIGTGTDANLRAAMLGGGNWYYTTQNAGPGWTDDTSGFPQMGLLIDDIVAGAGGLISGAGGLVVA